MSREVRAAVSALSSVADTLVKLVASPGGVSRAPIVARVSQVAEWLGVGERAVRKMMDRGELPWAWAGRQRVVPVSVWMDHLAAQAKANGQPGCGR